LEQKAHASNWLLFPDNMGKHLSIDQTAFSNGELYTIVTNKKAKGKKGALVAMVNGTKAGNLYYLTLNYLFWSAFFYQILKKNEFELLIEVVHIK